MTDAMRLLQRIVQSAEPPKGLIVVLSAWGEDAQETKARHTKAHQLAERLRADMWMPLAGNTHEEAQGTLRAAVFSDNIIIVTSAYHQLRAFLTFIKVFEETTIRLWNAPAPSAWDKLEGELQKIAAYQAKGYVASYAEGLAHLAWRDSYNCAGAA